ncbi:UNVERIFIED_CONTAM: hypothetical protein FKN15_046054 [Acipenser sinensis]
MEPSSGQAVPRNPCREWGIAEAKDHKVIRHCSQLLYSGRIVNQPQRFSGRKIKQTTHQTGGPCSLLPARHLAVTGYRCGPIKANDNLTTVNP